MTSNADIAREVNLIDRDRRLISNAGIKIATRIGGQAQRFTTNAVRYGHDPVYAARAVLLGNGNTDHASLSDVLAHTMLVSNLKGRRRTVLNARGHIEPIALARDLDDQEAALLALLFLTAEEIADWRAFYLSISTKLVEESASRLFEQLGEAGLSEIRQRYFDAGFAGESPYAITNLFETAGVRGYEDGRYEAWQNEQIRESLFGFHYSAILDDRTTELCTTLDGTVLPKDDPFWLRWKPPNHFHCRSTLVEVWRSSALNEPEPIPTRATPEQLVRFAAERFRFNSYF